MQKRLVFGMLLGIAPLALADYATDFEAPTYSASPAGVALAGQDGWFVPAVTGSIGFNAHTYAGNAYGLPANPDGDGQFAAGRSQGGTAFARAERLFDFSTSQTWCFSWDFACNYDGVAPATHNIASFSLQPGATAPPANRIFIALNTFVDPLNPVAWSSSYIVHDAAGTQAAQPGLFAGPEWQNLPFNTWFRQTTEVNMAENRIVSVSITNLATGATTTAAPANWYLGGGSAPAIPLATAVRMFAGGTTAGNIAAFDNISITPECGGGDPCACVGDLNGDGQIELADLSLFLSSFGSSAPNIPTPCADVDGNGVVELSDLTQFLSAFGSSCP
jgi:hypothetical protein